MLTRSDFPVDAGPALDADCLAAGFGTLPIAAAYVPRDHDAGKIPAIRQVATADPSVRTAPPIGPTDKMGPFDQALHLDLGALSGRRAQLGAIKRSNANGMSSDFDRVAVADMCDRTCDLLRGQDRDQPRNVVGKSLRRVDGDDRQRQEAEDNKSRGLHATVSSRKARFVHVMFPSFKAMLRKSAPSMTAPFPAILQRTASISALPRAEKRFMMAMRIWISAVWRAGSRDMILSPKSFRQFIRASTRLRT